MRNINTRETCALSHVIEVYPINQCLSKCRPTWFLPGVGDVAVQVGYIVVLCGPQYLVPEPGKLSWNHSTMCCREVLPGESGLLFKFEVGRSGRLEPCSAIHVGDGRGTPTRRLSVVSSEQVCLIACVAWLLDVVGIVGICQVETNIELVSCSSRSAYILTHIYE